MRKCLLLCMVVFLACGGAGATEITEDYPHLKKYLFSEPESRLRFGVGVTPILLMNSKVGVSASLLQIHWQNNWLDWELLNASFSTTLSSDPNSKMNVFTFRTFPKYRILDLISVGPILGLEFVTFPDISARLNRNGLFAPTETFSSHGVIYGAGASETFKLGTAFVLRMNEVVYQETYGTEGTRNGWNYRYSETALNTDRSPINPGTVVAFEFSFLY